MSAPIRLTLKMFRDLDFYVKTPSLFLSQGILMFSLCPDTTALAWQSHKQLPFLKYTHIHTEALKAQC